MSGITDHIAHDRLREKLKVQHEPYAMRPQLYGILQAPGAPLSIHNLRLQWMCSSGLGGDALSHVNEQDTKAAHSLLKSGLLAASPFMTSRGGFSLARIHVLEDMNVGIEKDNGFAFFHLSGFKDVPDVIIRPDETYDAAIMEIRQRIDSGRAAIESRPLHLKDGRGTIVYPIIFDRRWIEMQNRLAP